MRLTAVVLAAAASLAFPSSQSMAAEPVEPVIANPTQVIDNAVAEDLAALITEIGGKDAQIKQADAAKSIVFLDGNIPYNVGLTLCDIRPGKCVGILLLVIVDTGSTTAPPQESFNAANKKNLFATMVRLEDNKFAAGRILLIDGGVTRKNLASNIGAFADGFREAMKSFSQVVADNRPRGAPPAPFVPARAVRLPPAELARIVQEMTAQMKANLSFGR